MRRWLVLLTCATLLAALAGCGSEAERGKYKNKDKPVPTEPK